MTETGKNSRSINEIDAITPYAVPLRIPFRGTTLREGLLLHGPYGWSEWAPFPEYDDTTAARWLLAALEQATQPAAPQQRTRIPVNAIIPAIDPASARQLVREAYDNHGCTTIKVKVAEPGQSIVDDLARLKAIKAELPQTIIRIDVNGAWTLPQARVNLEQLVDAAQGLEYVEQPCATLQDTARLREGTDIAIAIDEGLRAHSDEQGLAQRIRDAADIVILKAIPLGGVVRSLRLAAEIGLPVIVSGSLDTSIGLTAGLRLAAAVPELAGAAGLGTGALLRRDVVAHPLLPREGVIDVGLSSHQEPHDVPPMSAKQQQWWLARLERAARHLDETG